MPEPTMNTNSLTIPDVPTGSEYLARLPLASPPAAESQLLQFLDALLAEPPPADTLLSLLELARVPLCVVEEQMACRHHNKPLPLDMEEQAGFVRVLSAWKKMRQAYERCAQMAEPLVNNPEFKGLIATVLHRCLYYTGMVIFEYFRARRELPQGLWLDLHRYFATAEKWGVADTPIEDSLESNLQATHCTAAYVTLLLIEVASPYSNSVRNLNLIRRWAATWSPLVSIRPLDDELEMPPYIVELGKDLPLHATNTNEHVGTDARGLDTSRLGLQLSHMLSQLRQRMTPSQLGLGEETSSYVIALLEPLSRLWTQAASPRRFRRFPSVGCARVAVGFEAMHFYISNTDFARVDAASAYSRDEFNMLFTFRDSANPSVAPNLRAKLDYPVDEWSVINHSANGFRLARSGEGQKVTHNELLSICPHDGEQFLLAQASWLMEESDGGLLLGVYILPGLPQGIAARPHEPLESKRERYSRAFLLPAVSAINEEGSLVLPKGLYQASRILDIQHDVTLTQVRLKHMLRRGIDFDRVSYDQL